MLARALVVLLLVLNLGVAAWWTLRAPPAPAPAFVPPSDVARLQLVSEKPGAKPAAPAPAPVAQGLPAASPASATPPATPTPDTAIAATPPPATPAASARCYSVGPFANASAANSAREVLMAVASRVVPREQRTGSPRGWRVYLPPMASLAEAQAAAQRIAGAGFGDYFIVRQGNEANSIALGRYRNEESARRRADSLAAAGFAVRAEPLGDGGPSTVWLDLVAKPEFDPARAEAAVQVPARELDCARIR
ncbi:SPOR domain-containing protein [Lysobacter sp. MMG2]|uniref:SPOR domain-containing protein n=1 Tax=Lysobacter sp. MMG2 TaxID=2801338 RepID=UPI001C22D362|nr:SPOR domain-containing protein [Lysobacter sp. MMG2]MBU8975740.1 SPOR domain-containing protein [Lysobacter sp. MMG2]